MRWRPLASPRCRSGFLMRLGSRPANAQCLTHVARGLLDVLLGMGGADETGLELGRGDINAHVQQGVKETGETRKIGLACVGEVTDRTRSKEEAEHGTVAVK